ncbi:MAG: TIGR03790 family protein [Verrucomicrobiota bacterium]
MIFVCQKNRSSGKRCSEQKNPFRRNTVFWVIFFLVFVGSLWSSDELKNHAVIVYNSNYPESESIAHEYAKLRGIGGDRVIGLECSQNEEISRKEFEETLLKPLERVFLQNNWIQRFADRERFGSKVFELKKSVRNEIWVLVLIHGIPLKIAHDPQLQDVEVPRPELSSNAAAVDSELALFPIYGTPRTGPLRNPFYQPDIGRRYDVFDSDQMILVGRLDGPTPMIVRRMMKESIEAEENRLVGRACLDLRGINDPKNPYAQGDQWLKDAEISLKKHGFPLDKDVKAELFPDWLPWNQIGIYLGWYEGNAQGPFMKSRCFSTGAIAYHIHSTSASTLRSSTANWAGPLLASGATATMGCVYEPYLDMTPHLDIFMKRLLEGYSFGEAAYASQKVLSWMTTVVGDPLYTPFKKAIDEAIGVAQENKSDRLPWLEMQRRKIKVDQSPDVDRVQLLSDISPIEGNPWVLEEAGDFLNEKKDSLNAASQFYERAYSHASSGIDRVRIGSKAARASALLGKWNRAYEILQELSTRFPDEFLKRGGVVALQTISGRADAPSVPASLEPYLKVSSGVYDGPF